MSKSVEKASVEVRDGLEPVSVLDFLYHDAQRVGSFLSQFDPSGHLTGLKQTESAETGEGSRAGGSASGTLAIARAGTSFEDQKSSLAREQLERAYDPIWSNAIELLGLLDEKGLLQRDLSQARMGRFVLVSGALSVLDYSMMKAIWDNTSLRSKLEQGIAAGTLAGAGIPADIPAPRDRHQKALLAGAKQEALQTGKAILELIRNLPHTIQARMRDDQGRIFSCSLRESGLVGTAADLFLKHGVLITGTWKIVGILDALPDGEDVDQEGGIAAFRQMGGILGNALLALAPLAREFGRPTNAYGITPLVIYRTTAA